MDVYASSSTGPVTNEPYKVSYVGNECEDGRYEIPIHCHGENIVSGELLAAAILKAAESNSLITASLEGNILTYTSRATVSLLPDGWIRGAYGEIFTMMFRCSAPQNQGNSMNSGLAFRTNTGYQTVSYTDTYSGETVQIVANSPSTRQVIGITLSTTSGLPRNLDISTFGLFRGTKSVDDFSPYWGERVSLFLSEPLRSHMYGKDIAYLMRGYTERNLKLVPFQPQSATVEDITSSYPIYRVPLPEAFCGQEKIYLDRFYLAPNQSTLTSGSLRYMLAEDGNSILVSARTDEKTVESFLDYFNSFNVHFICPRSETLIERFEPIKIPTRKGRNYIELQTSVSPNSIHFTYL